MISNAIAAKKQLPFLRTIDVLTRDMASPERPTKRWAKKNPLCISSDSPKPSMARMLSMYRIPPVLVCVIFASAQ